MTLVAPCRLARWRSLALGFASLIAACSGGGGGTGASDTADLFSAQVFADPQQEFGPMIRWWWPGGSVEDEAVEDHLQTLQGVGYAGVEIQPFASAFSEQDIANDPRIRTVGEPDFLERLKNAACAAQSLGLQLDINLGSAWPTGSPAVSKFETERQLLLAELDLTGPMSFEGALPEPSEPGWMELARNLLQSVGAFDTDFTLTAVLASEILDAEAEPPLLDETRDLTPLVTGNTLQWDVPDGVFRVFAIYENTTSHIVNGGAYPGEPTDARVIDHLDPQGMETAIAAIGDPWLDALDECLPGAVFVDSFELLGELPWTGAFAERFEDALGYDLVPFLPFVFREGGESRYTDLLRGGHGPLRYQLEQGSAERVREDYEAVRASLFHDGFFLPLRQWTNERGVKLRVQAYSGHGVSLDDYAVIDIPEVEDLNAGGLFDFQKLASSAAHVTGNRVVSSESLVALGARELTLDESWLLMGRAFSAGINRAVHHGSAYPYTRVDEERWYPFGGSPVFTLDIHPGADAWAWLPELNRAHARLSYAMTRGTHVAELAWLFPEREVADRPVSKENAVTPGFGESAPSKELRRAGYVYDRISPAMLTNASADGGRVDVGMASYAALLISDLHAADPAMLEAVDEIASAGVPVVWLGDFPSRALGLSDAEARDAEVAALTTELGSKVHQVVSLSDVPATLIEQDVIPALSSVASSGAFVSIERRRASNGDLFFLFNENGEALEATLRINVPYDEALLLSIETGESSPAPVTDGLLQLPSLEPARGVILLLSGTPPP